MPQRPSPLSRQRRRAARAALSPHSSTATAPALRLQAFRPGARSGSRGSQSTATLVSAGRVGQDLGLYLRRLPCRFAHPTRCPRRSVGGPRPVPERTAEGPVAEVYGQARRLDASLAARPQEDPDGTLVRRPVRGLRTTRSGWRLTSAGLVCEYLRCRPHTVAAGWCGVTPTARGASGSSVPMFLPSGDDHSHRERLKAEAPTYFYHHRDAQSANGRRPFRHLFGMSDRARNPWDDAARQVHTYSEKVPVRRSRSCWPLASAARRHVSFVGRQRRSKTVRASSPS